MEGASDGQSLKLVAHAQVALTRRAHFVGKLGRMAGDNQISGFQDGI